MAQYNFTIKPEECVDSYLHSNMTDIESVTNKKVPIYKFFDYGCRESCINEMEDCKNRYRAFNIDGPVHTVYTILSSPSANASDDCLQKVEDFLNQYFFSCVGSGVFRKKVYKSLTICDKIFYRNAITIRRFNRKEHEKYFHSRAYLSTDCVVVNFPGIPDACMLSFTMYVLKTQELLKYIDSNWSDELFGYAWCMNRGYRGFVEVHAEDLPVSNYAWKTSNSKLELIMEKYPKTLEHTEMGEKFLEGFLKCLLSELSVVDMLPAACFMFFNRSAHYLGFSPEGFLNYNGFLTYSRDYLTGHAPTFSHTYEFYKTMRLLDPVFVLLFKDYYGTPNTIYEQVLGILEDSFKHEFEKLNEVEKLESSFLKSSFSKGVTETLQNYLLKGE